ncbi:MAG: hypothetical protein WDO71_08485 [Bacteroidota bacterium]
MNTYRNIGRNDVLGLSASFTYKWKQKLTFTATVNLRQGFLESEALQQSSSVSSMVVILISVIL